MIQNILALTIVFAAAGFTVFSIIKNLTAKKASNCGGCAGCSLKELPLVKQTKAIQSHNYKFDRIFVLKHGK